MFKGLNVKVAPISKFDNSLGVRHPFHVQIINVFIVESNGLAIDTIEKNVIQERERDEGQNNILH